MIKTKCYLKDIREYEENTQENILRLFNKISISNMVKILMIFDKNLSEDDCYREIDEYLSNEENDIVGLYNELRDSLLGYKYLDEHNTDNNDNDSSEDINSYKFLSDFYMKLCMQLMSLGVTYQEFWSFTTKEMYQVFYGIQQKMILDYNAKMQVAYNEAALIGGAVWGKLPAEAPHIDLNKNKLNDYDDDEEIDTPLGRMTRGNYNLYLALEHPELTVKE